MPKPQGSQSKGILKIPQHGRKTNQGQLELRIHSQNSQLIPHLLGGLFTPSLNVSLQAETLPGPQGRREGIIFGTRTSKYHCTTTHGLCLKNNSSQLADASAMSCWIKWLCKKHGCVGRLWSRSFLRLQEGLTSASFKWRGASQLSWGPHRGVHTRNSVMASNNHWATQAAATEPTFLLLNSSQGSAHLSFSGLQIRAGLF